MKNILQYIIISIFILPNLSFADEKGAISSITNKISSSVSNTISNLIGGDGDREVIISAGEDYKPEFSIMSVRSISPYTPHTDDEVVFVQLQLNNIKIRGDERFAANAGIGKRFLSKNKNTITGANAFVDFDQEGNGRVSIGVELRRSAIEIHGNMYEAISGANTVSSTTERALGGRDVSIIGEVPFLPWANVVYNHYYWHAEKNSKDSKGERLSAELTITPNLVIEAGHGQNNIDGGSNFAKVSFVYPAKEKVAASTNFIGESLFSPGDMSGEMLTKVRRKNKIIIESEGSGVVMSRGD